MDSATSAVENFKSFPMRSTGACCRCRAHSATSAVENFKRFPMRGTGARQSALSFVLVKYGAARAVVCRGMRFVCS